MSDVIGICVLIERAGVKLKLQKWSFVQTQIEYFGHELSSESVRLGERKIMEDKNFTMPKDVRGVWRCEGLVSYYRKFIQNLSFLYVLSMG